MTFALGRLTGTFDVTQNALSKTLLRQAFRTNLDRGQHEGGQSSAELREKSERLTERLTQFLKTETGIWATFEPSGFEPDIRLAMTKSPHIDWAYPRVEGENLAFYLIASREALIENKWRILEPNPAVSTPVDASQLQGLLIPGLAFDERGGRLGRGRGFYDRALDLISQTHKKNQTTFPKKIGVALERQVSQTELPVDPHDIVMDHVITEDRIIGLSQWRRT